MGRDGLEWDAAEWNERSRNGTAGDWLEWKRVELHRMENGVGWERAEWNGMEWNAIEWTWIGLDRIG